MTALSNAPALANETTHGLPAPEQRPRTTTSSSETARRRPAHHRHHDGDPMLLPLSRTLVTKVAVQESGNLFETAAA
jgi:hypothetical protein